MVGYLYYYLMEDCDSKLLVGKAGVVELHQDEEDLPVGVVVVELVSWF